MFNRLRTIMTLLIVVSFCFMQVPAFAASMSDEAVLGNNRWSVDSSGNLVPNANTYTIGSATQYPSSIWVAGSEYTSFAAGTDGNWTDNGTTTTLDQAPTKFIATHSTGNLQATQFGVGTSGILGVTNAQTITLETNNAFIFGDNSDTATMTFTGDDVSLNTSDGGYIFALTDATDGTVDIQANNDTNDYISFTTVANVPTIVTVGTCNLEIAPDGGTTTVTGALTVTGLTTSSAIAVSNTITLQNSETIVNSTNGTVTVGGATNPILNVLDDGTSDSDATLSLSADAAADNGDVWRLTSDGTTNSLFFENNTSGSQATILTLAKTGLLTLVNGEYINNNTTDNTVTVGSSAAAMILSVYSSNATNGTAALNLVGDAQADATDSFQLINSANGTLTIGNDSTAAGTYIAKATIDSTGAFTVQGSEATAGSIAIWSDNGDDAADKFTLSMSAEDALTFVTGATTSASVDTTGLWTFPVGVTSSLATDASSLTVGSIITAGGIACAKQLYVGDDIDMSVSGTGTYDLTLKTNMADALSITDGTDIMVFATTTGTPTVTITPATTITGTLTETGAIVANGNVTLGDAITDSTTFTGKIAGASPLSFDGATANTVYTIFAMDDPASSSKTITFPAVTGTVKLSSAAVALTPGSAVTLTVAKGTTLYTDTPTDNEDQTITFSGAGAAGDEVTIVFTSTGTADEVITFHATLCSSTGTLTLGTTTAHYMVMRFISDGSKWHEASRTADQT